MTAHELARQLLAGPDLMVTRRGYEGGVEEITDVMEPTALALDLYVGREWVGRHNYVDYPEDGPIYEGCTIISAIHLS
jgi:hypothetical protein